jgi:predicted nucleic acid-binding protein
LSKALLDTDTLSEIGKGVNLTVAANATAYRRAFGHYTTSAVSVMEIARGFQQNQSTRRLQAFVASLATLEILPFDLPDAELAGRIAGDLERVGRPIGVADPMIAAIAITNGQVLVTGNTAHFQRIQQLGYYITLVDWRI